MNPSHLLYPTPAKPCPVRSTGTASGGRQDASREASSPHDPAARQERRATQVTLLQHYSRELYNSETDLWDLEPNIVLDLPSPDGAKEGPAAGPRVAPVRGGGPPHPSSVLSGHPQPSSLHKSKSGMTPEP